MEVYPVLAHHVVLMTRVREVVNLDSVHHTGTNEAEAVLPEHDWIDGTLADEKLALEVFSLVDEACLLITLRIDRRMSHVAFAVHYLIPFPVDYRTSGYSKL